jgi:hypothetical protein
MAGNAGDFSVTKYNAGMFRQRSRHILTQFIRRRVIFIDGMGGIVKTNGFQADRNPFGYNSIVTTQACGMSAFAIDVVTVMWYLLSLQ